MQPAINKESVYTVKIFFMNPINLISNITDILIQLEFETYTVNKEDRGYLISVLNKNIRNIIYICVLNKLETDFWLEYIDKILKLQKSFLQIGVFVYNNIEEEMKMKFLVRGISVITFSDIKENTLSVIKRVLQYYEAKGRRKYIRAKAIGKSEVYFNFKYMKVSLKYSIIDISVTAFSALITDANSSYFRIGTVYKNIQLVLMGMRVTCSVKLLGFSKENPEIFIFKFQKETMIEGNSGYSDGLNEDNRIKIHKYIKKCLKENLNYHLSEARKKKTI
jgi:hypothetical protein